ncbi:fructokinase [Granulicella sp. dw_53]|uniref:fructokinase n=1 Tax=Granulicella sp. dw_53 TaxID=2719792 RepID=UPI0031F60EF5
MKVKQGMKDAAMRIGIDLGGTKIEALAIDKDGKELLRYRVPTPREDYEGTIAAMVGLVQRIEKETGAVGTVGAGIPGSVSSRTGLVKNANSTWLNGMPFDRDLSAAMGREVRVANDANCLAVSEATDGAAAGKRVVFAVIVGTGCGGGVALNGQVHAGINGVGGEWGHNPLPWASPEEYPGPVCYCGKRGCLEMWISGTGVARDFLEVTGRAQSGPEIMAACEAGVPDAVAAVERLEDRLARALAHVINILDPDVFVFGGGLSKVERIYREVPKRLSRYVFGGETETPLLQAKFGDSSGVRGAAWLWPNLD